MVGIHGLVVSLFHVLRLGQSLIHVCATLVPTYIAMTQEEEREEGSGEIKGERKRRRGEVHLWRSPSPRKII